jgi:hypothetical protein
MYRRVVEKGVMKQQDELELYDALWDKLFAESQAVLERLADEAHAEYLAGLTEEFDPDERPDTV